MKKRPDFMMVIMVLCFAAVALIFVSKLNKTKDSVINYEIMPVKKEQHEIKTTIEGVIEISNPVEIKITRNLKVKAVNYSEGDQIKKGDVIATFSTFVTKRAKNGKRYRAERIRRYVSGQDGYIFKMNLKEGEEIPETAFVIVKPENIKLYTRRIKQEDRDKIMPGTSVAVKFYDNEKIQSEIIRVEKTEGSNDLRGELVVTDPERILKNADRNISIDAVSQQKKEVLAIPVKTVIKKEKADGNYENYVYVLDINNKAAERQVLLGEVNGGIIYVNKGLEDGDRVVVNPDNNLKDGTSIKINDSK